MFSWAVRACQLFPLTLTVTVCFSAFEKGFKPLDRKEASHGSLHSLCTQDNNFWPGESVLGTKKRL